MADQVVTKTVLMRFSAAQADFQTALNVANAALSASPNPAISNLVRALAYYSRSTPDSLTFPNNWTTSIATSTTLQPELDGKQGPFSLKMR